MNKSEVHRKKEWRDMVQPGRGERETVKRLEEIESSIKAVSARLSRVESIMAVLNTPSPRPTVIDVPVESGGEAPPILTEATAGEGDSNEPA
jgi:hypothetical protein